LVSTSLSDTSSAFVNIEMSLSATILSRA
jgi:hypothetical protein